MKKKYKALIELYASLWEDFNLFGKCFIFPIFLIASPVMFLVILGQKEN